MTGRSRALVRRAQTIMRWLRRFDAPAGRMSRGQHRGMPVQSDRASRRRSDSPRPPQPSPRVDAAALREEGATWSVCVFTIALWALSWMTSPPIEPSAADVPCTYPRELFAEAGWTRVVSCEPPPGGGRPLRGPVRWLYDGRVELNGAEARLLDALPGIGPARAAGIVEERQRRPFGALGDLTRVHGIGRGTVSRLRPFLRVEPPKPLDRMSAHADGER